MSYEVSYLGLHGWYKSLYIKFGWMVLAKAHGYKSRIAAYKECIEELLKHIESRSKTISGQDKLEDLKILKENTLLLNKTVKKYF